MSIVWKGLKGVVKKRAVRPVEKENGWTLMGLDGEIILTSLSSLSLVTCDKYSITFTISELLKIQTYSDRRCST